MQNLLNKIKELNLDDLKKDNILKSDLLIHSDRRGLDVVYAPFEHVNKKAKVIIVGITPGWTQLKSSYKYVIENKNAGDDILKIQAKRYASFSGAMRTRLIRWLDEIGVSEALRVETCSMLFNDLNDKTIHTSSVLRYPTFYNFVNYSGHSPKLFKTPYFIKQIQNIFLPEMEDFSNSLIIPLGSAVQSVFDYIKEKKMKNFKYILSGFPHSSSLNVGSETIFKKNKVNFDKIVSIWKDYVQ
jgi:hypothetical protein